MSQRRGKSIRKRKLSAFHAYASVLVVSNSESEDSDKDDLENVDPGEILERILVQKEIIANVKAKPWPMQKKLNVLKKAKAFVEKYEGRLSKTKGYSEAGKEIWRKLTNYYNIMCAVLTPWDNRIKTVESYFGSSVASYFVFLRWIAYINAVTGMFCFAFLVLPELIAGNKDEPHKIMSIREQRNAWNLETIWAFGGYLEHSVLFYGHYTSDRIIGNGYRLPLAYFIVGLATFAYGFIALLRKMAKNNKIQGSGSSEDEYAFSWKTFCSWDHMIANPETAENKAAAIVTAMREAIVEEEEKEKEEDTRKKLRLFLRILANFLVLLLLAGSLYYIQYVVTKSQKQEGDTNTNKSFYEQNEVSIVVTLITLITPSIFEVISTMEQYHPRNTLRLQLGRILMLYLGNLYTLMIALLNHVTEATSSTASTKGKRSVDILAPAIDIEYYIDKNQEMKRLLAANRTTLSVTTTPVMITKLISTTVLEETTATTLLPFKTRTLFPPHNTQSECWETFVGQELMRLTIIDLLSTVFTILIIDFIRALIVKYANPCCCWDLETKFPEYGEFKIAENVLHLIYNQGITWIGSFFCPLLPTINVAKLTILMYLRSWAVVVCNVPHSKVFRATGSNNFYLGMLLFMLFLSLLPIMWVLVRLPPSNCGPFRNRPWMHTVVSETLDQDMPGWIKKAISYAGTPVIILPVILLLLMVIYYLQALASASKENNNRLKLQLHFERKEGKKNIYKMGIDKKGISSTSDVNTKNSMPVQIHNPPLSKQNSASSALRTPAKSMKNQELLSMPSLPREKRKHRRKKLLDERNDSGVTEESISMSSASNRGEQKNRMDAIKLWQNNSGDVSDLTDCDLPRFSDAKYFERCSSRANTHLMCDSTNFINSASCSPVSNYSRYTNNNLDESLTFGPHIRPNYLTLHELKHRQQHVACSCQNLHSVLAPSAKPNVVYVEYDAATGTIGNVIGKAPPNIQHAPSFHAPENLQCCSSSNLNNVCYPQPHYGSCTLGSMKHQTPTRFHSSFEHNPLIGTNGKSLTLKPTSCLNECKTSEKDIFKVKEREHRVNNNETAENKSLETKISFESTENTPPNERRKMSTISADRKLQRSNNLDEEDSNITENILHSV